MKAKTLNPKPLIQLCCKVAKAMVFQEHQKIQFIVFFVFGLVCCFAGYCGVALVS
jgi:hypothetical protein